ncbi:hypothetical protein BH09CHL1_BH09CHL1_10740 [soil metagenome]
MANKQHRLPSPKYGPLPSQRERVAQRPGEGARSKKSAFALNAQPSHRRCGAPSSTAVGEGESLLPRRQPAANSRERWRPTCFTVDEVNQAASQRTLGRHELIRGNRNDGIGLG